MIVWMYNSDGKVKEHKRGFAEKCVVVGCWVGFYYLVGNEGKGE